MRSNPLTPPPNPRAHLEGRGVETGFRVCHQLQGLAQTHVHRVSDAIQPSHPLSSLPPPTFILSQHQGLISQTVLAIADIIENY